jgi:hypothetical protein
MTIGLTIPSLDSLESCKLVTGSHRSILTRCARLPGAYLHRLFSRGVDGAAAASESPLTSLDQRLRDKQGSTPHRASDFVSVSVSFTPVCGQPPRYLGGGGLAVCGPETRGARRRIELESERRATDRGFKSLRSRSSDQGEHRYVRIMTDVWCPPWSHLPPIGASAVTRVQIASRATSVLSAATCPKIAL